LGEILGIKPLYLAADADNGFLTKSFHTHCLQALQPARFTLLEKVSNSTEHHSPLSFVAEPNKRVFN
jgi:hypothetical protein